MEVKAETDSAEVKIEADCDDITVCPQDDQPLASMSFVFLMLNYLHLFICVS